MTTPNDHGYFFLACRCGLFIKTNTLAATDVYAMHLEDSRFPAA